MQPALMVSVIAGVAKALRTRLQPELPAGDLPGERLLKRAIQVLVASKAVPLDNDLQFLQNSALVNLLLKNIVAMATSNPSGDLTKDALKQLLKTCLGTPSGEGAATPPNRASVPPRAGKHNYRYCIVQPLPELKGGISEAVFRELVQAAWHRWQDAVERLTVIAVRDESKANMRIGFTQLDGTGRKLAEATLKTPGTNEYRLQIDIAESWNASKLLGTLIHEIGHTLGMEHTSVPGSIMYFQADSGLGSMDPLNIQLTPADIDAIPRFWR